VGATIRDGGSGGSGALRAGAGEDRELVAQEQVLSDQVGPAAQRGVHGPEEQDEELKHARRMHDPEPVRPFAVPQPLSLFTDFEGFAVCKPEPRRAKELQTMLDQVIAWGTALRTVRSGPGTDAA
jgi:hypothetical protein